MPKYCQQCQKSFEQNPLAKRPMNYCSETCAREAYNEHRRAVTAAKRPPNFVCHFCQKTCEQTATRKYLRYCSEECARKANYWRNRPAEIERMKKWRADNPELYKQIKQRHYQNNKTEIKLKHRDWQMQKDHGMTLVQYDGECEKRQNKCDICQRECAPRTLRPDHDHSTQARRGMLCDSCNLGIGKLQDSSKVLQAAADYLRRFGC